MIHKHPKDESYYSERYDRMTIDECECWDSEVCDAYAKSGKKFDPEKPSRRLHGGYLADFYSCFIKGERYLRKEETVRQWMESDRAKDEKLESAVEPKGVRCINCSSPDMSCISRDLMTDSQNEESVLFMFQCGKCGNRRAYWENGVEWKPRPNPCPKCRAEMRSERSRRCDVIEIIYFCPKCQYTENDIIDLGKKEEFVDPDFETKRKKYCLSDEEGKKYSSAKITMEQASSFMEKWKEKEENKDLYDAIDNIKKLTISDLQKFLDPIIERAGYAKLEFEKPDLQKDVILGFGLQDAKSGRSDRESAYELKKLLKKSLEGTNWRLMSEGVSYRLGFLTGRLRGAEGEEDFKKLILDNKN
ncbi:MAG: hypothetical protein A2259_01685 [Candidatus Moranbacteria bacterium RIFOXYA2_FULL_43_15]|nr:MAG: hypothetical protein A2259_01685 [Candidatus Moranbacteria bacterium RIFOXYA2_FULL_43_15]